MEDEGLESEPGNSEESASPLAGTRQVREAAGQLLLCLAHRTCVQAAETLCICIRRPASNFL